MFNILFLIYIPTHDVNLFLATHGTSKRYFLFSVDTKFTLILLESVICTLYIKQTPT